MLCKIAEHDIETEDLPWQDISVPGTSRTSPNRTQSSATSRAGAASRQTPSSKDKDSAASEGQVSELAAQQALEREQAYRKGLEQGAKQARQEAAAEVEGALDRLARAIQEVAQVKRRVRGEAENELVKLSLAIARRILHRELTTDPQSLSGVVYAALQRLQNREITKIRVFPAAVPAVKAALERNGGLSTIEIVGDGQLQPGGLLFETSIGELDASVDTQLQEIERGFTDRLQLR